MSARAAGGRPRSRRPAGASRRAPRGRTPRRGSGRAPRCRWLRPRRHSRPCGAGTRAASERRTRRRPAGCAGLAWPCQCPNPPDCRLERSEARKVIEPRIYRAAFLPALLALVLVAFSLVTAPRAVPQGLAADALFEGTSAVAMVRDIVTTTPDRRAGRPGDARLASRVKQAFLSHKFPTTIDRWSEDGVRMANVIGRRPGATSKQIVVMAARDASGIPDEAGSAGDTAAL